MPMAPSTSPPLLLRLHIAVFFCLLALSATSTARPCRTFFISSHSIPANFHRRYLPADADQNPSSATLTSFTEIRSFIPFYVVGRVYHDGDKPSVATQIFLPRPLPGHQHHPHDEVQIERRGVSSHVRVPLGFSSAYDFSSLRERTKDILSVVVALLFGVGCGALTAATMYMVWSVFSNRYEFGASYDDHVDDDGREDEIKSPKKMGYVKIPAAEAVPAPAKEAV